MARIGVLVALALLAAVTPTTLAQSGNLLPNGDFEEGDYGWSPFATGATVTVDGTAPLYAGAMAAHLVATGAGALSFDSQYWWAPTTELTMHAMSVWVHADDADIQDVSASLEVLDEEGSVIANATGTPGPGTGWRKITVGPVPPVAGSAYVRVVVTASATSVGAILHVDSAWVTTASPEPSPTATATATATVITTSTALPTPEPTSMPTPEPTPVATRADTRADARGDARADDEPTPEPTPGGDARADARADACADARANPGPDARANPGPDARANPGGDARANPGGDARAHPGPDARANPGPDTRADPGPDARGDAGGDARADACADARADPGPDARAR